MGRKVLSLCTFFIKISIYWALVSVRFLGGVKESVRVCALGFGGYFVFV